MNSGFIPSSVVLKDKFVNRRIAALFRLLEYRYIDAAVVLRVFYRICYEIKKTLLQAPAVADNIGMFDVGNIYSKALVFFLGFSLGFYKKYYIAYHIVEVEIFFVKREIERL